MDNHFITGLLVVLAIVMLGESPATMIATLALPIRGSLRAIVPDVTVADICTTG
jgi:hypothetical protein